MAPCDTLAEDFTSPVSPFRDSLVRRDVAHLHHLCTSASRPTDSHADTYWAGPGCSKHTRTPPEHMDSASPSPVTPSHPTSRDTDILASRIRPIRRRPSLINPRVDIEDSAPERCPSCRLRRRSSVEATELRSPKYIHTVLDECCSKYCPDISLVPAVYPLNARPHIGRSRLSEQFRGHRGLVSDQNVASPYLPNPPREQFDYGQNGCEIVQESGTSSVEEDDNECLVSSRFHLLAILATSSA